MKTWNNIGKWAAQLAIYAAIIVAVMEIAYRFQWIDFYKKEWQYQNGSIKKDGILVFGDSFSADPNGWLQCFKDNTDEIVMNASVPGIGPESHKLFFERRVNESKPKHILIQLYVGNDLYDSKKPVNWSEQGLLRNLYWTSSNNFRILGFMNYRLGQLSVESINQGSPKNDSIFDTSKYSPRTKLYISGDPSYPESHICVERPHLGFECLIEHLQEMKSKTPKGVELSILIIPHCTQISKEYRENYKALGSKIEVDKVPPPIWKTLIESEGFYVIDPTDVLRKAEKRNISAYYPNDPHLNEAGSRIVAEYVENQISKR